MNGGVLVAQNEDVAVESCANYQTEVGLFFLMTRLKTVKCSGEMLRNRSVCVLERKQETALFSTSRKALQAGTCKQNGSWQSVG